MVYDFFCVILKEKYYLVVMDDVGILKILQNEPFDVSKERDLIEILKEKVQSPPLGPIQKDHHKVVAS
jgi:hypothetical protein